MGVYIKGMGMPTSCCECAIKSWNGEDDVCPFSGISALSIGRQDDCPLVPVPLHGRLIDADALITTFCEWGTRLERGRKLVITMSEAKQAIVDIIDSDPTIIPANKEGEG